MKIKNTDSAHALPHNRNTLRIAACLVLSALAAPAWATDNCDGNSLDGGGSIDASSLACGNQNSAPGTRSTAVGVFNIATGDHSTAVGFLNIASGNHSTALGSVGWISENSHNSIAIGATSYTNGYTGVEESKSAIAIGNNARINTGADDSIAIGTFTKVNSGVTGAVALGAGAVATQSNTVSVGASGAERRIVNVANGTSGTDAVNKNQLDAVNTTANNANSTATTAQSAANTAQTDATTALTKATDAQTTANSAYSTATTAQSTANTAQTDATTALTKATDAQTTANSAYSTATTAQSTANTAQTDATSALTNIQAAVNQLLQSGVCSMTGGTVSCNGKVQLGNGSAADGANAVAVGNGASAAYDGAVAIGDGATITAPTGGGPIMGAVAIGRGARANADPSVAIGNFADATGADAVAIGDNAAATGNQAVALGYQSSAIHANSVALGAGSITSAANTVSVGSAGADRRITNVAAPINADDVATKGYVDGLVGSSGAMLGQAIAYTDGQVEAARKYAAKGIAATAAIMNVTPSAVGKTALGVASGYYDGQAAIGVSLAHAPHTGMLISGGIATSSGGKPVARAGFAFEF